MSLNNSLSEANNARLLQREEEYKRLNAELEAQTAMLVKEAEVMMQDQENFLREVSPAHTSSADSKLKSISKNSEEDIVDVLSHDTDLLTIAAGAFDDLSDKDDDFTLNISKSYNKTVPSALKRPHSKASNRSGKNSRSSTKSRNNYNTLEQAPNSGRSAPNSGRSSKVTSHFEKISSHKIEQDAVYDDEIMPVTADEMGSEAQIRFLKAKLRVVHEELKSQTGQLHSVNEECRKYKVELKEAKEETDKMKKSFNQQQTQITKLKHGFEEEQKKNEASALRLQNVSKELESLKREKKQSSTVHSATEVRLNRAMEDLDKLKAQLQKQKLSDKEVSSRDHREMENLRAENKRLERLRNDSLTVMKKQQKLIGILKRQILHIEAAKLLSFTEDEFVKALDWGNK